MEQEQIIFVSEDGTPTGETGPKLASHTGDTKLHLAFSCYIFRRTDNQFLLTQRAMSKKVWPGVWTNSVCGHPMPGEALEDAIRRRAKDEIGLQHLEDIRCILPSYRYKTPPYDGIIENEFCPVFIGYTSEEVTANLQEVEAYEWLEWSDYVTLLHTHPERMSYWAEDQYLQLKDADPFASFVAPL